MVEGALKRFISAHCRFYPIGILLTILIFLFGSWFGKDLKIDTDLTRLLPQESKTVQNLEIINDKAGSRQDLVLILARGELDARKRAIDEFALFLEDQDDFPVSVQHTPPKTFFQNYRFHLLPIPALESLSELIEEKREEHEEITDPFGLEAIDSEASKEEPSPPQSEEQQEALLEASKTILAELDAMQDYYQTPDGRFIAMRVLPEAESLDVAANRRLLEQFTTYIDEFDFTRFDPNIKTSVHGVIPDHLRRYDAIVSDLTFGAWGLLIILFLLVIFFRSVWALLTVLPCLIAGLAMGIGLVRFTEQELNTIAIFLVLVVFGLGIDFGIHLWTRMLQERKTKSLEQSLFYTWSHTGRATLTSACAVLFGFALLSFSSFQGFAQFGRVATIFLATTAGLFLFLMPSWIALVERIRGERSWPTSLADLLWTRADRVPSQLWKKWGRGFIRLSSLGLLGAGILCSLLWVRFDYQFSESIRREEIPAERNSLSDMFQERRSPSAIALFEDTDTAHEFIHYFQKNSQQYPEISFILGAPTFYPPNQEERLDELRWIADSMDPGWVEDWDDPLFQEALLDIYYHSYDWEKFSQSEVPSVLLDSFEATDGSGDSLVFIFDTGGPADGQKAMKFSETVDKLLQDAQVTPIISGQEVIFADIVRRVTHEGPWLILGMFILVFLICLADFRRLRDAAIVMTPVLFGFILTGLVMALWNIQLNFYNMVALASLGSIVVDNSIHIYHRYLGFRSQLESQSSRKACFAVGPTVVIATLTSICGYGGMLFASHMGINSLGDVAVIGLSCCMLSAVVFFPPWLSRWEQDI